MGTVELEYRKSVDWRFDIWCRARDKFQHDLGLNTSALHHGFENNGYY